MTDLITRKPRANSSKGQQELDKVEKQFEAFNDKVQELTLDRMNQAPKKELEPQTKMSQNELANTRDIYLKPKRSIGSKEKFNEAYRDQYDFAKEYVNFIAQNNMIVGEAIEMWTKPFAGLPAEEWVVPCNKPVWAPRYVAEQIKRCSYHVLSMSAEANQNNYTGSDSAGEYHGQMVVDNVVNRIDANPVIRQKSVFMGARNF